MSDECYGGPHARTTDPVTSHLAAEDLESVKAHVIKARMLYQYALAALEQRGLTDYEAAVAANFDPKNGRWKRCSDMRNHDLWIIQVIEVSGPVTRVNPDSGKANMVCTITDAGIAELQTRGMWGS